MSDALSDGARAGCLDDAYQNYFVALVEYLKSGSDPIKVVAVVTAAREVDENQRGRGTLAENTPQILAELQDNNRTTWARALMTAMESRGRLFSQAQFKELRALSPFADKKIRYVECRYGYVFVKGETPDKPFEGQENNLVWNLRKKQGGLIESFCILYPGSDEGEPEVIPLEQDFDS